MRTNRILLIAAIIVSLSASAWAQASPTPTNEEGTRYNEIIRADGTRERVKVRVLKGPLPWRVGRMKMLGPGIGWALTSGGLVWTVDNGAHWKNIGPRGHLGDDEHICDIFFLDARYGWVLFGKYDEPDPKFEVDYTTDTGSTWSRVKLDLGHLATEGRIAFADKKHGWMILATDTSSAFNAGALFATNDGGRTWQSTAEDPGGRGPMTMISSETGWIVGNGEEENLNVTRDGARTWQTVSLPAPKEIAPAIYPSSDVPAFEDKRHGFVAVTYIGGASAPTSAVVLFATSDGGRTWKPDRILANLEEEQQGRVVPSTVADSIWITARVTDRGVALTKLGPGARGRADIKDPKWQSSGYFLADQLSFVTPKQGWVIVGDGDLLSTTDGGATWTDITPGPKSQLLQSPAP